MAWCPHCSQDRPIKRQTLTGSCAYCHTVLENGHEAWCRGPVNGALDVCGFCHTPVFAEALDSVTYARLLSAESVGRAPKEQELREYETQFEEYRKRNSERRGCLPVLLLLLAGVVTAVAAIALAT